MLTVGFSTLAMTLPEVASCRTSPTSLFSRFPLGPGPTQERHGSPADVPMPSLRRQPYCPSVYGEASQKTADGDSRKPA